MSKAPNAINQVHMIWIMHLRVLEGHEFTVDFGSLAAQAPHRMLRHLSEALRQPMWIKNFLKQKIFQVFKDKNMFYYEFSKVCTILKGKGKEVKDTRCLSFAELCHCVTKLCWAWLLQVPLKISLKQFWVNSHNDFLNNIM